MGSDLALIAAFIVAFGLVSGRLSKSALTPPIVFVAFGLAVGPSGLDLIDLSLGNEVVRTLAELTLVLVLFTDAARIELKVLRRNSQIPIRLLGIGLPLTIAAGALTGALLFPGFDLWEAALLAAILAPTDAALGQAVISSPAVPLRIRQALNVESGLNDGIAVPFVTIFLAGAGAAEGLGSAGFWVRFAAEQIGFGLLIGIATGLVFGALIDRATAREWMNHTFQQLAVLAVPIFAFSAAEVVDGNGFIAAFIAGITMGNVTRNVCHGLFEFSEEEGQLLGLLTFMIFGGAFVGPALGELTWPIALYAVASLTVVRIVPVLISQAGLGLRLDTRMFLGWFGPRGLASIVFGLFVLEALDVAVGEALFAVATWTILLSVVAHGLTARSWATWYGARVSSMTHEKAEMQEVEELPTRG